ncbi:MAG: hypothetical protein JWO13_2642 [Acidobacteriales bacterium]|nr:hypothetical protein [Terriglobales bacterium]
MASSPAVKQQTVGQKYSVTPHPVSTLLTWVQSGEIAIPEIQRPFVWDATKVRNLLDSLHKGFPIGYLISWKNPDVKLKDGTRSEGKRILIDGQQRVTALMACILGKQVLTKDYEQVRITIAFNPLEHRFEVANPAIQKDSAWIPDIAQVFDPKCSILTLVQEFTTKNKGASQDDVFRSIEALKSIVNNHVGLIELNSDLDIETVTEIFIRVNSEGSPLSQADFVMSKIAANEAFKGNELRKAIDYFCHMAKWPDFYNTVKQNDKEFAKSELFAKMSWLKSETDDIYDPSYTDMLRVAFTSEFRRGKLQDLVALLSGRNFETKQFEEAVAEESFAKLRTGVVNFMNETHFKRFVMIIRSAGFVVPDMISSGNALNVAYVLYLTLRSKGLDGASIESPVRRWFVMSQLLGRYSGSAESQMDFDIRQMHDKGVDAYLELEERGQLSEAFWESALPQAMNTSSSSSPYYKVYLAAQVKANDRGFLSRDIGVTDLILNRADAHHIFPKDFLKKASFSKGRYNQIANFALTQTEINIGIGNKAPSVYLAEVFAQCNGGKLKHGGITDEAEFLKNLKMHCVPEEARSWGADEYEKFLEERRQLMAAKMKNYYSSL